MANFVLRAGHFLLHPFGTATAPQPLDPAGAGPRQTAAKQASACPKIHDGDGGSARRNSGGDLDRMGLTRSDRETHDSRDDLTYLSLDRDDHASRGGANPARYADDWA